MGPVYLSLALLAAGANLFAGGWGAWLWLRRRHSQPFWFLLRVAQFTVVVQVGAAAVLYLGGREAEGSLHYLYVSLPLVVTVFAEAIRAGAAQQELRGIDFHALPLPRQRRIAEAILRRETGIMAASALVSAFLVLRGFETSGYL